ncbi:MAG: hypothetical protein Kow0069_16480 [Promethearchaeota archaeon]
MEVQNTAGQLEQETKSRHWNVVEALVAMALIQVVMWAVWFPMELAEKPDAETVAVALFVPLALYFLFVSPFLHKDTLKGWGLGDPRHVVEKLRGGPAKSRAFFAAVVLLLVVVGAVAVSAFWEDVAGFVGLNDADAAAFKASPGGAIAVALLGGAVGAFLALFVVRYDNFLNALKVALVVIVALGVPLFLLALTIGDVSQVSASEFAVGVFGYIFWGAIQQFLFSSYFGTRFRKGFAPSEELEGPAAATREQEKRLYKRRFLVSVINGSFFGLIHVPSWTLTAFTMTLGVVLSWLFMKDANRNLLALGLIHGFLGSMAGQFFSDDVVEMSVGPSAVPAEVAPWMWLVALAIGVYLVVVYLVWRRLHPESDR